MPAKRFESLLSAPPKPLPDDDEVPVDEAEIEVVAEPEPVVVAKEPQAEPEQPPAIAEPGVQATQPVQPEAPPPPALPADQASTPATGGDERSTDSQPAMKVPLTLRLHPPAARAFRDAWFDARRTLDPTLSSPEFASKIVMLGLESYRQQKTN